MTTPQPKGRFLQRLQEQESEIQNLKTENQSLKDRLEDQERDIHSLKFKSETLTNRLENLEKWKRKVDGWLAENFDPIEEDNTVDDPTIQVQKENPEVHDDLETSMEFVSSSGSILKEPESQPVLGGNISPILDDSTIPNSIDNGPQVSSSSPSQEPKSPLTHTFLEPLETDQGNPTVPGAGTFPKVSPLKTDNVGRNPAISPAKKTIVDHDEIPGPSSKRIKTGPRGLGTMKENQVLGQATCLENHPSTSHSASQNCENQNNAELARLEGDPEDIPCAICGDSGVSDEERDQNLIFFCDGCNLAVHQGCYLIANIPKNDQPWFCRPCANNMKPAQLECCVCFNRGGALRLAFTPAMNKWVHVYCVWYTPGLTFGTRNQAEMIIGFGNLHPDRFLLTCAVCKSKKGPKIQCQFKRCSVTFHPTCAKNARFKMIMDDSDPTIDVLFQSYCKKHS